MTTDDLRVALPDLTWAEVDSGTGPVILEFGASWCGFCRAFAPILVRLRAEFPGVRVIWVEDARGRPLGRSFQVKLWPTLVFLRDGVIIARLVRPTVDETRVALKAILRPSDQDAARGGDEDCSNCR